jgi:hypothetical protein
MRFIVIMLALTLVTLGLAYSVIHGPGSSGADPAAPAPAAPRSE